MRHFVLCGIMTFVSKSRHFVKRHFDKWHYATRHCTIAPIGCSLFYQVIPQYPGLVYQGAIEGGSCIVVDLNQGILTEGDGSVRLTSLCKLV